MLFFLSVEISLFPQIRDFNAVKNVSTITIHDNSVHDQIINCILGQEAESADIRNGEMPGVQRARGEAHPLRISHMFLVQVE